ncbi:MAG: hypothetical protein IT370_01585 [Deltaproteobacteria bacterium]|nr:hypothetical protein [Deltaproteobacteria bacterium]
MTVLAAASGCGADDDGDDDVDAATSGADGGNGVAFCNADLDLMSSTGVVGLRYPMTIISGITAGERDTTWVGALRAASPIVNQDCPARFETTPPGPPCSADSQIDLGGSLLTVGLPLADLSAIPTGQAVHVRARAGFAVGATPSADNLLVDITRQSDGAPLVVAGAFSYPTGSALAPPWSFGYLTLRLDATPVCRNQPRDVCRRSFLSRALAVEAPSGTVRLEPGQSAEFPTLYGRYRVTLRGLVERGGGEGDECADYQPPRASFEIVRLGD